MTGERVLSTGWVEVSLSGFSTERFSCHFFAGLCENNTGDGAGVEPRGDLLLAAAASDQASARKFPESTWRDRPRTGATQLT